MPLKKQRIWYLGLFTLFVGGVTLIVLSTLNNHLLFFMMPSDVLSLKPTQPIRLGGLVKKGSLQRYKDSLFVTFIVCDKNNEILVHYQGLTPDLFREGQGVVTEGVWTGELFQATSLLAKHDENYMPRDVAEVLKINRQ